MSSIRTCESNLDEHVLLLHHRSNEVMVDSSQASPDATVPSSRFKVSVEILADLSYLSRYTETHSGQQHQISRLGG
jgi:hypothetical protein